MSRNRSKEARISQSVVAAILSVCLALACSCRSEQSSPAVGPPPTSPGGTNSSAIPNQEVPASTVPKAQAEESPQTTPAEPSTEPSKPAEGEKSDPNAVEPEPAAPAEAEMANDENSRADGREKFDFGKPLVEGLTDNELLQPKQPVWLTRDGKSVVMQSLVCQREAPLEMFVCMLNSKEHESVLTVPVTASVVHTGLLATGAEPGSPVRWDPEYKPPTGTEIEITLFWKDKDGKVQQAKGQDWVRDASTGKAMAHPWVFAGSKMYKDEETGREYYMGDSSGDLICVSNFPSATLDVPIQSSDSDAALLFEAFTEHIPPLGTPVTIVLTPKLPPKDDEAQKGN